MNTYPTVKYPRFGALLSVALFTLSLALILPFEALAAQPCGKGKNPTPCWDGFPTPGSYTLGEFDDQYFTVAEQLFVRTLSSNDQAGDYVAVEPELYDVTIDLHYLNKLPSRKRYEEVCHLMDNDPEPNTPNHGFTGFPSEFSYGWTDACTDEDGCAVEISMTFTEGIAELTNDMSDTAVIVMYTRLPQTTHDDPFDKEDWALGCTSCSPYGIELIEVTYNKFGTSRTLVTCGHVIGGHGGPVFYSSHD